MTYIPVRKNERMWILRNLSNVRYWHFDSSSMQDSKRWSSDFLFLIHMNCGILKSPIHISIIMLWYEWKYLTFPFLKIPIEIKENYLTNHTIFFVSTTIKIRLKFFLRSIKTPIKLPVTKSEHMNNLIKCYSRFAYIWYCSRLNTTEINYRDLMVSIKNLVQFNDILPKENFINHCKLIFLILSITNV